MNIGCLLYNCIGYGMLIELYLVQSGLEISTELEILAGVSYFYWNLSFFYILLKYA